ncbi:DUF6064 family protein [Roseovarius aestuarii]|uniref:MFS transporter permease n=1 Tax=Roseovarius aestuarii TaxID=475083 RepID=A0A1X7BYL6_9RHOB|nr:DUF6064 family protein [Roseovarius aestuarii]SMC14698.1 hypothetical protein ROA7745_04568 [Roseovarius aestuarii]
MIDWLNYSLRDFLMFGSEVYWRLFALHNQAHWPLPVVAIALGLAILLLMAAPNGPRRRLTGLLMALSWVGAAHFLATRYAPINWPMAYAAWAFAAEAVMIAPLTMYGAPAQARPATRLAGGIGLAVFAYVLLLHPFVGLLFGRPLSQAELFGLAPDPTALASLGLVLLIGRSRWRVALSVIPVVWCVVSAATLFALGEPQGLMLVFVLGLWGAGMVSGATRATWRGQR